MKYSHSVLGLLALLFLLLSFSCQSSKSTSATGQEGYVSSPYLSVSADGRQRTLYNYDEELGQVLNDQVGRGILVLDYDDANRLSTISYLNKDSVLHRVARKRLSYDAQGRLIKSAHLSNRGEEMWEPTEYRYDEAGFLTEVFTPGGRSRIALGFPGMAKYSYTDGLLTKVAYFNSLGEPAITNEMGVSYVTFAYNAAGQLTSEILHYTGTTNADDPADTEWIYEYAYNDDGSLQTIRYKFDRTSDAYDSESILVYDHERKLYGVGKVGTTFKPTTPYTDISSIVYQHVYIGFFPPHVHTPTFRN